MQYAGRCFNEIEKLCQSFTTAKTNDACFDHAKQITTQQQQHQQQQEQQQQQQQQQQVQVNQMEEKSVFNSISSRKQLEQGDLKHFPHYLLTFTRSPRALPRRTQIQSSFGSKDSVNIGNMNSPSPTNGNISFRDFDQLTKNQAATNKCTASGASNASNSSVLANVDDLCSKSNSHSKVTAFHEYEEGKTFAPLNASYKGMKERSKSGNFNQSSKSPVTYESKSSEVKKILSTTDGASISRVNKFFSSLFFFSTLVCTVCILMLTEQFIAYLHSLCTVLYTFILPLDHLLSCIYTHSVDKETSLVYLPFRHPHFLIVTVIVILIRPYFIHFSLDSGLIFSRKTLFTLMLQFAWKNRPFA